MQKREHADNFLFTFGNLVLVTSFFFVLVLSDVPSCSELPYTNVFINQPYCAMIA